MSLSVKPGSSTTTLLSAAAVVVVILGMQAASSILVPFMVSVFLAVVCKPPMNWLTHHRVPTGVAIAIVVFAIISLLTAGGMFLGGSIAEFTGRLPFYEQRLNEELIDLAGFFGQTVTIQELLEKIQPGSVMGLVANLLNGLQGLFANFFLIIFTVIFILLESSSFPVKMRSVLAAARADPDYFVRFTSSVQRYLGIKTLISLVTGLAAGLLTGILGLDFPVLWGVFAFTLNYVPSIGSIIAAIPPTVLALVQFGLGQSLLVALGYLAINISLGGIIEPRVMGRNLDLSTLVIFLSLIFWGWVFGPVGMLLSVPLTMIAKIALEASDRTTPLAALLSAPES